jgi:hypothetical protein
MNEPSNNTQDIMSAIRAGKVHMVPRWRFWLSAVLAAIAGLLLLSTMLYLASFAVFGLRQTGVLFVPTFGMHGIVVFLQALPFVLIGLVVVFLFFLELLARRYPLVYRRPLLTSVFLVLIIVVLGGVAIERTHIHGTLYRQARAHLLPPPIDAMYGAGGARVPDVERGAVVAVTPHGLIIREDDGEATSTVLIDPHTRLPFGATFSVGQEVVVFGDESSGTIRALGIRTIEE